MDSQEYEIKNQSVSASIQGFQSGSVSEDNRTRLLNNPSNSLYSATGTPTSPLYPVPENIYNSMENVYQNDDFNKSEYGKNNLPLVAKPPPHVMTSLGPMPLPIEVRRKIPEKFVAKPIVEEREIYVAKKELQERTIEIPHIQYDHKFSKVPKMLNIKKLIPSVKEIVREVPREVFKPVIEEKVIEVPQGVKYVEVPVEVPCFYPPKIVAKPKEQIVERVVETIKPVVKEKIIEVPQTVVKNVPKIKTVEVPYFVPKYVEKIIEVPYHPGAPNSLLPPLSTGMPPNIQGIFQGQNQMINYDNMRNFSGQYPFKMDDQSQSEINIPYEAKFNMNIVEPMKSTGIDETVINNTPFISTSIPIELPTGVKWGAPPNIPPPYSKGLPQFLDYPSSLKMPPMMVTFPPEVGQVSYCGKVSDPDILTRSGVMPYRGFKKIGTAQILFPPLPYHINVPMKENGIPDIETINDLSSKVEDGNDLLRRRTDQSEEYYAGQSYGYSGCSNCCNP